MDKYLCDTDHADCKRSKDQPVDFLRPIRYYLFDPSWSMLANYLFLDGNVQLFKE